MEVEAEVELWALWPWPWSCWWRGSGQAEPALRRRRRWRSLACCSRPALCATASTACHAARPGLSKASLPHRGCSMLLWVSNLNLDFLCTMYIYFASLETNHSKVYFLKKQSVWSPMVYSVQCPNHFYSFPFAAI